MLVVCKGYLGVLYRQWQRSLNVGGSITVWLVSNFTSLDSTASLHTNNNIFYFLSTGDQLYSDTCLNGECSLVGCTLLHFLRQTFLVSCLPKRPRLSVKRSASFNFESRPLKLFFHNFFTEFFWRDENEDLSYIGLVTSAAKKWILRENKKRFRLKNWNS